MIHTPSLQLANALTQPNWGQLIGVGNPRYLVTRLMVQHWRGYSNAERDILLGEPGGRNWRRISIDMTRLLRGDGRTPAGKD